MYLNNAKEFKSNWDGQIKEIYPQYNEIKAILKNIDFASDVNKAEVDRSQLKCLDILKNIDFIKFDSSKQRSLNVNLLTDPNSLS